MTQKQIVVVGGGVIGVCTAFFLADAGHEVVVIERNQNVAQEASFAHAGIIGPGYVTPWTMPGRLQRLMARWRKTEAPLVIARGADRATRRWLGRWMAEHELERFRINRERLQRLAYYSRAVQQQLAEACQIDYEQTDGVLQLFRTEHDRKQAETVIALLGEQEIVHRLLTADEAREIEPALASETRLAGALYMPEDASGNCPLFTKKLRHAAQSIGVHFYLGSTVKAIEPQGGRISLQIDEGSFQADAVVVAAGVDSARLLRPLGIQLPLHPVKGYSATASIKNFDRAPQAAIVDEAYKVAITRLGSRVRVAGTALLGETRDALHQGALRTLMKVGNDWFPQAANYTTANFWCGVQPMLPDGPPVLGATPVRNVYVNIGHGANGWAMAAGSGRILANLISGQAPEIDIEGLTLSRYG
ncbi:D-amino acid dehydrogenase [Noviherbaspirillum galbum]|uniref:FAD-dependent oxidoreductase n=1 Tax=Noviherbaspirillum galbum TaxID=2709383 RepID=A0A6B3SQR4_9BURK|nr:D-amino acid dehydrogenase [Noviherbaspirillum galbum]NEX62858.1 FAD-dependent oxidoreductase [Noviherbaspirillum galbum]